MQIAAGGLATTIAAPHILRAQSGKTIVVAANGGAYEQAIKETVLQPFTKETGINVVYSTQNLEAQIKAQVDSGNVQTDAVEVAGTPFQSQAEKLLEEIDYGAFDKETLASLLPEAKAKFGAGYYIFSSVMAYSLPDWPQGKPRPQTWADFWDVKRFPGPRTLQWDGKGDGTTLAFALIASGVDPAKLYPLDIDRAYKSLDAIKPHITKFWSVGAEPAQLLSDRQVVVGSAWNGRIQSLKDQGAPVELNWNQGEMAMTYWVVPRGTKNRDLAMKFVAYASSAAAQARLQSRMAYGPTNSGAFTHLDQKLAGKLPSSPENIKNQFWRNDGWLRAVQPNGQTNREVLIDRWTKWVLT
jgi:putative spermidine/putrescine transport system substrate-binding protein